MRKIPEDLQPAQAVALRMQAMQHDLQRARQHLRRERRSRNAGGDRWGLEQAAVAPQDEDWLITYLDMVTLLMVAMIVMLAFAGPISRQIKAARHDRVVARAMPPAAIAPPLAPAAAPQIPPPEAPAPYPALPTEALGYATPPAAPVLAPLDGTFPEPVAAASLPATPGPAASPSPDPHGAPAALIESEPDEAPPAAVAAYSNDEVSTRMDQARIAGWRARGGMTTPALAPATSIPVASAPAAATKPAMDNHLAGPSATPAAPAAASTPGGPAPAQATPAEPAESEGEAMAASLPLGELGKDVEVIVNKRSVSFRVNSEILFSTGKADLSREGLTVLKRMAEVLVKAGYDITVEGHTDSVRVRSSAPYPSNWELSSARAGSVVRYLQANGIPKSRLKAVGFADSHPIADNDTPEGRARNRRVELVVSKHHDE